MGNWNIIGIAIIIGMFFTLLGLLMTQIDVVNPLNGAEQSLLQTVLNWILPF